MKKAFAEIKEYKTNSGRTEYFVWVSKNGIGIDGKTCYTRAEAENFASIYNKKQW